ncbi:MAG TPA: NTP transferase domain-containing protein [Acidobacteriaceae bacterium]|jgi:putative nucleotidyltransferase with HDIG domain|nr:NTP transferase domain-containing protein [Acidobacteriaceae bacterium]
MNSPPSIRNNAQPLAAVVLAAGASSRMGRLKPLLPLAGIPALERAIAVFHDAGIDDVRVVLGHRAQDLRPLVERCRARCIENPSFAEGMYSSVLAAARALQPPTRAAFILPADVPLVRAATIRQLAAAFLAGSSAIVYPTFDNRRGHPPLIARAILDEAANGAPGPLRTLLAQHEHNAIEVPVVDEAIHLDMDTPADFDRLRRLAARRAIPTRVECEAMLEQHSVPEARIRHSRKVAEVAETIAEALAATGLAIDPELANAGALLHDIAKGQPKHAEAGAAIVRSYDMPTVAAIVAAHTEINFTGTLDERAIVYLADKLVAGEQIVTLEERFQPALLRFRDNPEARNAARRRKAVAEQIAAAIEARAGAPLTAILRQGLHPSMKEAAR